MNNPLGLFKAKLNEIFADVKILFQDNLEEVIRLDTMGPPMKKLQSLR